MEQKEDHRMGRYNLNNGEVVQETRSLRGCQSAAAHHATGEEDNADCDRPTLRTPSGTWKCNATGGRELDEGLIEDFCSLLRVPVAVDQWLRLLLVGIHLPWILCNVANDLIHGNRPELRISEPRNDRDLLKQVPHVLGALVDELLHVRFPVAVVGLHHKYDVPFRSYCPSHLHLTKLTLRDPLCEEDKHVSGVAHSIAHAPDCWILLDVQPKRCPHELLTYGQAQVLDGILCIRLLVAQEEVPSAFLVGYHSGFNFPRSSNDCALGLGRLHCIH
mmetsp:Transcript_40354/g.96269  ORF Transcript_40354/g.96269 Transcript_40354/m.96269 type:complete len:275 (-) Transcript_40354:94-918(-)